MTEASRVRCKFRCNQITKRRESYPPPGRFLFEAQFSAVSEGSEENKKFFAYTPSGNLSVGAYQEDLFEVGKEYYLDISPA
jgi:hypothetical protein